MIAHVVAELVDVVDLLLVLRHLRFQPLKGHVLVFGAALPIDARHQPVGEQGDGDSQQAHQKAQRAHCAGIAHVADHKRAVLQAFDIQIRHGGQENERGHRAVHPPVVRRAGCLAERQTAEGLQRHQRKGEHQLIQCAAFHAEGFEKREYVPQQGLAHIQRQVKHQRTVEHLRQRQVIQRETRQRHGGKVQQDVEHHARQALADAERGERKRHRDAEKQAKRAAGRRVTSAGVGTQKEKQRRKLQRAVEQGDRKNGQSHSCSPIKLVSALRKSRFLWRLTGRISPPIVTSHPLMRSTWARETRQAL